MDFLKNSDLHNSICLVQIRSVDTTVNIPDLTTIYHTPSKINFNYSSSTTASGVLHKRTLSLSYPGLSTVDFDKFNDLTRGVYQIYLKMDNGDIYEFSPAQIPSGCSINYNLKTGHELRFTSNAPIPIKFRENQPDDGINVSGFDYDFDFYLS